MGREELDDELDLSALMLAVQHRDVAMNMVRKLTKTVNENYIK